MLDLGLAESSDSQEDEGSPTVAENTPGNDLEVAQFAHTSDYADTGLVWLGFQLETGFWLRLGSRARESHIGDGICSGEW